MKVLLPLSMQPSLSRYCNGNTLAEGQVLRCFSFPTPAPGVQVLIMRIPPSALSSPFSSASAALSGSPLLSDRSWPWNAMDISFQHLHSIAIVISDMDRILCKTYSLFLSLLCVSRQNTWRCSLLAASASEKTPSFLPVEFSRCREKISLRSTWSWLGPQVRLNESECRLLVLTESALIRFRDRKASPQTYPHRRCPRDIFYLGHG